MADRERNPEIPIIGRDAHAVAGKRVADQLNQTTTEGAGGNASGTDEQGECEGLDIIFEHEEPEATIH